MDLKIIPKRFRWFWAAVPVAVAAFVVVHGPLTSADIRLDTGDLRYRYFGIPWEYKPMSEPERAQLLTLGAGSKVATDEWRMCATFPLISTNHEDWMCANYYRKVAIWAKEDPRLGRLLLEDLAMSFKQPNNIFCPSTLLSQRYLEWDGKGGQTIIPGWRRDPEVLEYMARKHYTPPSIRPSATWWPTPTA